MIPLKEGTLVMNNTNSLYVERMKNFEKPKIMHSRIKLRKKSFHVLENPGI